MTYEELLAENLTLKGGTAINIIHYSEIPRLSVDLDFDRATAMNAIKLIVKLGYRIEKNS